MAERIEQWLMAQGLRGAGVIEIMDGFCGHLVGEGFPLARGYIGLRTLHPKYGAVGFRWERGSGGVEAERYGHDSDNSPEFVQSPFAQLIARGGLDRRGVAKEDRPWRTRARSGSSSRVRSTPDTAG